MDGVLPLGVSSILVPPAMSISDSALPQSAALFVGSEIISHLSQDRIACYGKDLSEEQRAILNVVAEGKSLFFTGAAGMS